MMHKTDINLLGKDYFSEIEAAHYACVSVSQLRNKAKDYGIAPKRIMGKLVYRKADIQNAFEYEFTNNITLPR